MSKKRSNNRNAKKKNRKEKMEEMNDMPHIQIEEAGILGGNFQVHFNPVTPVDHLRSSIFPKELNPFPVESKQHEIDKYLALDPEIIMKDCDLFQLPPFDFREIAQEQLKPSVSVLNPEIVFDPFQPGRLIGLVETKSQVDEKLDPSESNSLVRKQGQADDFVRGNYGQQPFAPGGWTDVPKAFSNVKNKVSDGDNKNKDGKWELERLENEDDLMTLPPNFENEVKKTLLLRGGLRKESFDSDETIRNNPQSSEEKEEVEGESDDEEKKRNNDWKSSEEEQQKTFGFHDIFSDSSMEQLLRLRRDLEEYDDKKKPEEEGEEIIPILKKNDKKLEEEVGEKNYGEFSEPVFDQLIQLEEEEETGSGESIIMNEKKNFAIRETMDMSSNYDSLVPHPALTYPFDLDNWQKQAVYHIEQGDHVFVAAHTSAGKTVCAEYAIAISQKHLTRAIYTSPIKTLSNQKFREFKERFKGQVGLITGDVQINPTADCLIMTTEILRSMLYRGADLIRDVEWVIFDEVHYINDQQRGVVWEEVIILLPEHVRMIMLSATIPNTLEFANWVGRTKQKNVYIIETFRRPVPLEHHLFYDLNFYPIVDKSKKFLNRGYQQAVQARADHFKQANKNRGRGKGKSRGGHRGGWQRGESEVQHWEEVVKKLEEKGYLPTVVFSFSRRKCEELSYGFSERLDLTKRSEKTKIRSFIRKSIKTLSPVDRSLPQILSIESILMRGVGCHHSGLLPLVKEIVEILFSQGLCKILFATETFAMGVNMPAKTVVFNGLRKNDGVEFRQLSASEYIQMAGRAGRRGKDEVGRVLVHIGKAGTGRRNSTFPPDSDLRDLILGRSTELESKFRVTYNMILNLFRFNNSSKKRGREEGEFEEEENEESKKSSIQFGIYDMLRRSFSEARKEKFFISKKHVQRAKERLQDIEDTVKCIHVTPEEDFSRTHLFDYVELIEKYERCFQSISRCLIEGSQQQKRKKGRKFEYFDIGTVILAKFSERGYGLAFVKKVQRRRIFEQGKVSAVLCMSLPTSPSLQPTGTGYFSPSQLGGSFGGMGYSSSVSFSEGDVNLIRQTIPWSQIVLIYTNVIDGVVDGRITDEGGIWELVRLWREERLRLFESQKMKESSKVRKNMVFSEAQRSRKMILDRLSGLKCVGCSHLREHAKRVKKKTELKTELEKILFALSDENLKLLPEFEKRLGVLMKMGYVSEIDHMIQLKGRVASEVNVSNSLIVTEMVFNNFLSDLNEAECTAVLSCLVCKQKTYPEELGLSPQLDNLRVGMDKIAEKIGVVQEICGMEDMSAKDYVRHVIRAGLMEVGYRWCNGEDFSKIMEITDIQEGEIVRNIIQIAHLAREIRNCARVVGDVKLMKVMESVASRVKRDIVFAASLYLI